MHQQHTAQSAATFYTAPNQQSGTPGQNGQPIQNYQLAQLAKQAKQHASMTQYPSNQPQLNANNT